MRESELREQYEKWQQQLRKGVLIYMVLVLLAREELYGYALISSLSTRMDASMSEGTIYPLLNRMVRSGLIEFDWRIMESGPARKYYQITGSGRRMLSRMHEHWQNISEKLQGSEND